MPAGATPLEGLGAFSYRYTEEDMSRVDVWDDDTPCRLVFRWKGKARDTRVVEFARAGSATITQELVSRPVLDALVWTRVEGPEGVRRLEARMAQEKAAVQALLQLAPGFPKIVEGGIPGFGPGVHLVLGYCPVGSSAPVFDSLEALNPGMDILRVEVPATEAACPRLREYSQEMGTRSAKSGGKTLTVSVFGEPSEQNFLELTQVATLRDAKGVLLTTFVPERISVYNAFAASARPCQSKLKSAQAGAILVETVCTWNPGGCRTDNVDRYTETFRVVRGSIQSARVLKRREADCSTKD
jgi:hypothetical protein